MMAVITPEMHSIDDSTTTQGLRDGGCNVSRKGLLRVLQGVTVATKTSADATATLSQHISQYRRTDQDHEKRKTDTDHVHAGDSCAQDDSFSLHEWYCTLLNDSRDHRSQQLAMLALSVAFLRQHSRETSCAPVPSELMAFMWRLIHGVLTDPLLDPPLCTATRSAQGFLSVALCSLIEDGNIDELFRLHVWLPDGKRGGGIHSHQPFAQSWILAGEGTDIPYEVEKVTDPRIATHAEYVVAWSDGKSLSSTYKTHQTTSVIANTGSLVRATPQESVTHTRDMTYSIPSAVFHTSSVNPDTLHATLFFFDSQRGFDKNASVLGPVDGETFAAHRDPAGVTAMALAEMVQAVRSYEILMERGVECTQSRLFEQAVENFGSALHLCEAVQNFPNVKLYKSLALVELEKVERLLVKTVMSNTKPALQVS